MFSTTCEKCNGRMVMDTLATVTFYNKETTVLIDKDGNPSIKYLPDAVVLKCQKCNYIVVKQFDTLINDLKQFFLNSLLTFRKSNILRFENTPILNEENGLSYCGICPGPFDGDGYCLNDLKKSCAIRKLHVEKDNCEI